MNDFKLYRRTGLSELRYYLSGEDLLGASVSAEDIPESDIQMIARNPKNHDYACSQARSLDQEVDYLKDQLTTFTDIDIAIEIVKAHGYGVTKGIPHARGGVSADWINHKPEQLGRYLVRGFDDAGTEAMVFIAKNEGALVCNLHASNSEQFVKCCSLLSDLSDGFEWAKIYTHPVSGSSIDLEYETPTTDSHAKQRADGDQES